MIKILLDTNMFIYLEDNSVTNDKVLELTKRLYDLDEYKIVIHPMTKKEISNIKDGQQKRIFKSKIAVYSEIESPPVPLKSFHNLLGCKNINDEIDNNLIFAVYQNCVSFFITNDKEIKKKSFKLGIESKILTIDEALSIFKPKKELISNKIGFIHYKYLYELNLEDHFFDSLRNDYVGFDEWFKKKQLEGQKAYVTFHGDSIGAFLMLKIENENEIYNDLEIPFTKCKRLKISTFKVADLGKRFGESFIKIIVDTALLENVEEIYVTVFKKHNKLIELFKEYGFHYYCKKISKDNYEEVYVKSIRKKENFYPFFSLGDRRKFIAPIKEEFHSILFPDSDLVHQISIDDLKGTNYAANSLRKAYLCHSNIKKIVPGSIIFFYASGQKKAITSLGIVDAVFDSFNNYTEVLDLVKRRTVYDDEILRKYFKKNILVIMFKHYCSFDTYIPFEYLLDEKIVKGSIQSIIEVKEEKDVEKILDYANFNKEKYLLEADEL